MRADYQGLWVALDLSRSLRVERVAGEIHAKVWRGLGRAPLTGLCSATWHPRKPEAFSSPYARDRLDWLSIELGQAGVGPTYDLYFARENQAPAGPESLQWVPITPVAPVSAVRLFPEYGASFLEAALGPYDEAIEDERALYDWIDPLTTYRPASPAEVARFRG